MNPSSLSDRELLTETRRIADHERHTTGSLVSLLAEVDARRLYLDEGYSSLFTFCTSALRLSESAAYARITAARAARRFPAILELLRDGAISLTTVGLLAPHLEDDNHVRILEAARGLSKRDVERLVAGLQSQPDIPFSIRALPKSSVKAEAHAVPELPMANTSLSRAEVLTVSATPATPAPMPTIRSSLVAPIAPKRYLVRMTVSEETHRNLERARDLLRHQIPDGDPAAVFDLALTALIEKAERTKFAARKRPMSQREGVPAPRPNTDRAAPSRSPSRRIPAAVRRAVWTRDDGRCAFAGSDGRCGETGFLEFHHVAPFAFGGPSTLENLQLRCRAHNAYEAAREFGEWRLALLGDPTAETTGRAAARPLVPRVMATKREVLLSVISVWDHSLNPLKAATTDAVNPGPTIGGRQDAQLEVRRLRCLGTAGRPAQSN
jgi:hypothetical protein